MKENEWLSKYIEGLDSRLGNLESKIDSLLETKWQFAGGYIVIIAIIGIITQAVIAYYYGIH